MKTFVLDEYLKAEVKWYVVKIENEAFCRMVREPTFATLSFPKIAEVAMPTVVVRYNKLH